MERYHEISLSDFVRLARIAEHAQRSRMHELAWVIVAYLIDVGCDYASRETGKEFQNTFAIGLLTNDKAGVARHAREDRFRFSAGHSSQEMYSVTIPIENITQRYLGLWYKQALSDGRVGRIPDPKTVPASSRKATPADMASLWDEALMLVDLAWLKGPARRFLAVQINLDKGIPADVAARRKSIHRELV